MQSRVRGAVAIVIVALVAAACDYAHPPFLARVDGPVVIEGAAVPDVVALGLDPGWRCPGRFRLRRAWER